MGQYSSKATRSACTLMSFNKLYTAVSYNFSRLVSILNIKFEKYQFDLDLNQIPSEKLAIEIPHIGIVHTAYGSGLNYEIKLKFNNDVHLTTDVNSCYLYEIACLIEVHDSTKSPQPYLVELFVDRQERKDKEMSLGSIMESMKDVDQRETVKCIHIGVRRLRKSEVGYVIGRAPDTASLHKSIIGRMRHGLYSDVTLISADAEQIPAHKDILAQHSTVFSRIFGNKMADEDAEIIVEMEKFNGDVISVMLDFMYFGKICQNIMFSMALDVYAAAQEYEILRLVQECREFLIFKLSCENVRFIIRLAELYDDCYFLQQVKTCTNSQVENLKTTDVVKIE